MPTYPPMIRTDSSNAFAHNTMRVRVPEIIRQTNSLNPDFTPGIRAALEGLASAMEDDAPIPPLRLPAPDYDDWLRAYQAHEGETWQNTQWFYAEVYTYRLIMEAVRWWETERDPFAAKKHEEYSGERPWLLVEEALSAEGGREQKLAELLTFALWGNRIDLSFAASLAHGSEAGDDDLLVDDRARIVEHLLAADGTVHVIADNAGTELALDMVLVDGLLDGVADEVLLHLKLHPTFVSDATVRDIWDFLARLDAQRSAAINALGRRLRLAIDEGRLRLAPDAYWNSTLVLEDMPARMHRLFTDARLVLVKGDANYRRMVGDRLWSADTPLAQVVGFFPAPIAALRTLKSDAVVGLPPGMAGSLDGVDPLWRVNGRRGVLQARLP